MQPDGQAVLTSLVESSAQEMQVETAREQAVRALQQQQQPLQLPS